MQRRQFIQMVGGSAAASALVGCASSQINAKGGKVIVIGGGYGGATAAKYVRKFSNYTADVTLIEPNQNFISCPMSNLVIGGSKKIEDITVSYEGLRKNHGVNLVRDSVTSIDVAKRQVKLAGGASLFYDRLIVSPGIDLNYESLPGMKSQAAQDSVLHAWKAGAQTVALRQQLESMKDGGVFAISIPLAPYRCPPGPYERACQVADYFQKSKPKSKILILDANDDVTSKPGLFKLAWSRRYAGMVDYRPKHNLTDVDVKNKTLKFEFNDDIKANVLNVLPPMRAGGIALKTGLANMNNRWCEVDFLTFESKVAPNVHVLGDSIQIAPGMPKSGHMANQHGKTCAAAIVAILSGNEVSQMPIYNNTCYSFVSSTDVVHVASVHVYDAAKRTMVTVPGSGGISAAANPLEGEYANAWARNIWADMLV
ncbi:NAD(P)/FAD-dependent oxidoreductase [Polynucleobacter sp. 30F-ANTBAC]|jgi:sulfide dehydrogenase [flavocytochrome c] flavoprotein chain|uniref:NAD(P)/FAD-dependent oxidoreductase n=1 Tax=Polynucleobacter sp. 30F-ANTBAC TaxID=2689095 RepID=UPI001C0E63E2|nr:FAD/NAD(P)-binding oxidoreductase [Polynucleobacter sp. 30F-ANTBAC]MBU3598931.1 NAD(P)/FAD-dependent oxidoreductase [Polynucleobacter sp. 30F-ANTBAC]